MTAERVEARPPTVSVIVCTRNRAAMLCEALASIRAQDCRDFEVIVVDDGSEPPVRLSAAACGDDVVLRTRRISHGGPGAARAAGLEVARGDYVAWCDDDDLWAPTHLRRLLRYLCENPGVDLVYGDSEWLQDGARNVPYSIDHDRSLLSDDNYIFASDVVHRADAARRAGGFDPRLHAYEDWDLWLRMSLRGTIRHLPAVLGVRRWHQACASARDVWREWERVHSSHARRLRAAGPVAEHGLELGAARPAKAFDCSTWRPGRRELVVHTILRANQGYGSVARQMLLGLERAGVDVTIAPTLDQPVTGFERFYKPLDRWSRIALYYNYRHCPDVLPAPLLVNYSMAESTHVPPEAVQSINRSVALQLVPCRGNVQIFRDCGVRVPIRVLPHGVDPARFPRLEREPGRPVFTFGTFGELTPRKGTDVLLRAFLDEFGPNEPVRLLLKSVSAARAYRVADARVQVVSGFMGHGELLDLLRRMDAFVMPSRGEGFGLCGLEAIATGLPLIATNWSGPADYLDADDSYPLNHRLVDAAGTEAHHMRFYGQWAEPDYEHLRFLMRWVYEHPDEAARKGRAAAARVHRDRTWDQVARQLRDELDTLSKELAG